MKKLTIAACLPALPTGRQVGKAARALVLAIAVLTLGGVVLAATSSQSVKTIKRTVESVNLSGSRIFLKPTRNARDRIVVTSSTMLITVTRDGSRSTSLSDFRTGDKIRAYVRYHPDTSKPNAYLGLLVVKVVRPVGTTGGTSSSGGRSTPPPEALQPYVPSGTTTVVPAPNVPSSTPVPPPSIVAFANSSCSQPLPAPTGETVTVGTVSELRSALNRANDRGNLTVFIRDGTYEMDNGLWITGSNVTFRGLSGNRDRVVLRGKGTNGSISHIFWVRGDNVTIADMTIGWVKNHPIQVMGEEDPDNVHIRNVRIADAGEQLLKVSFNRDRRENKPENGIVECSLMEFTTAYGPWYYVGGIDAHNTKNWVVRDNVYKNIKAPPSDYNAGRWAEHAVHFWSNSENTLVERNIVINSDRGIGFGLGDAGHIGGIIRNNMIYHDSSRGDVGIGLENATGVQVLNNTVYFEHSYSNAIEYRYNGTMNTAISRNIVNKAIAQREGGSATLDNNVTNAERSWFRDPYNGDLRLTSSAPGNAYGIGAAW